MRKSTYTGERAALRFMSWFITSNSTAINQQTVVDNSVSECASLSWLPSSTRIQSAMVLHRSSEKFLRSVIRWDMLMPSIFVMRSSDPLTFVSSNVCLLTLDRGSSLKLLEASPGRICTASLTSAFPTTPRIVPRRECS